MGFTWQRTGQTDMPENFEFVYASFLIRLWRQTGPLSPDHPSDWQSEVEHIQSGHRWRFTSLDDLLAFLHQQPGKLETPTYSHQDIQE